MSKAIQRRTGASSRHRPIPFRDRTLASVVLDPGKDLRPWAAYTLGHETRMLPYYVSQFPTASFMGRSAFDGIPVAADRVRLAVDVLAGTIPPGVLSTMNRAWRSLVRRVGSFEHDFTERGALPGRDLTTGDLIARLALLADRAIPRPLPASRWFQLGCAVGEFYQKDQLHDGPEGIPFRPVAEAARRVTCAEQHDCPELHQVAVLLDRPEAATEEGLRNLCIDRSDPDWPHPDESPWPNSPFFGQQVRRLHLSIDEYLREGSEARQLPSPPPTAAESPPQQHPDSQSETAIKPRWEKTTGRLWFGDHLAAEFHDRGEVLVAILDRFEESNWEPIDDPHPRAIYIKGEHVASLNKRVKYIRFRGSGTKRGIRWERRMPQTPS
jgi:hypothetical protein